MDYADAPEARSCPFHALRNSLHAKQRKNDDEEYEDHEEVDDVRRGLGDGENHLLHARDQKHEAQQAHIG